MKTRRLIPASNQIHQFYHCGLCMDEYKRDFADRMSPREYAMNEAGATGIGIQVWCKRHEVNVVHVDFEGYTHPANGAAEGEIEAAPRANAPIDEALLHSIVASYVKAVQGDYRDRITETTREFTTMVASTFFRRDLFLRMYGPSDDAEAKE